MGSWMTLISERSRNPSSTNCSQMRRLSSDVVCTPPSGSTPHQAKLLMHPQQCSISQQDWIGIQAHKAEQTYLHISSQTNTRGTQDVCGWIDGLCWHAYNVGGLVHQDRCYSRSDCLLKPAERSSRGAWCPSQDEGPRTLFHVVLGPISRCRIPHCWANGLNLE